jgi:uncharacterized protein (DUF952 family)
MVDTERHAAKRRTELGAKLAEDLGPGRIVGHHRDRIAHRENILNPPGDDGTDRVWPPAVSVIFHIASGRDWERATSSGTYTTESMHRHGVIACSLPAQHAAVANQLSAGRTDLVLLLIETDRLQSEVRFEQADAHGQPVPNAYGPVNLDAVFEATPYRPGVDGRFRPHEEASGFAVHGAATPTRPGAGLGTPRSRQALDPRGVRRRPHDARLPPGTG